MEDPIIVNTRLIESLSIYIENHSNQLRYLLARFLSSFINDATFVESYEVDNFILRNSEFMTKWYNTNGNINGFRLTWYF